MTKKSPPRSRFSSIMIIIILVALGISITAFYQAIIAYGNQEFSVGSYFALIGIMGLTFLTYMMIQTRKRTFKLPIQAQRVATTILCQKCGFKNIRDFERGDYILKDTEECPKCNDKMIIASIYREAEEKKGKKELS
jgi:hypothetical protein